MSLPFKKDVLMKTIQWRETRMIRGSLKVYKENKPQVWSSDYSEDQIVAKYLHICIARH